MEATTATPTQESNEACAGPDGHMQPENTEQQSSKRPKLKATFIKWLSRGIKVVVLAYVSKFAVERLDELRNSSKWGPGSSEDFASSDLDSESDMATSSEVAEEILEYLEEGKDPSDMKGWTKQEIARGLRKIDDQDLEDLGLEEEHIPALIDRLQEIADRLDPNDSGEATQSSAPNGGLSGEGADQATPSSSSRPGSTAKSPLIRSPGKPVVVKTIRRFPKPGDPDEAAAADRDQAPQQSGSTAADNSGQQQDGPKQS